MRRYLAVLALSVVVGCDSEHNQPTCQYPSNVVVAVSGEQLTVEDLRSYADLVLKKKSSGLPLSKEALERQKKRFSEYRIKTFPGARLLCQEAKRQGIAVDRAKYDAMMKTFEKFPAEVHGLAAQLVEEDLTIAALRRQIDLEVPDIEPTKIERCLKRIESHNEMAAATNAATMARLGDVRRRILSNQISFDAAAKSESEDEWVDEMGCEWGEFKLADLDGENELLSALPKMKKSSITEPISLDGGYALVRLDAEADGVYTLSRIFRRRMASMELETAEQLNARFRKEEVERRLNALAARLLRDHPPIYPNGHKFQK